MFYRDHLVDEKQKQRPGTISCHFSFFSSLLIMRSNNIITEENSFDVYHL